jgi:hypothetical protein
MEGGAEVEAVTPRLGQVEKPPEAAAAEVRTRMRVPMRRPEAAAWAVEPRALVLARGEWALTGRQEQGGLPP